MVEGECHVNESLLTGESNPIHKRSGDELMSGSFIDAGLVVARVIHVGADNYVARINNEAKYVKKVNSEIMNALNAIVRFASVFMVPIGIALFCASANSAYRAWCALDPNSFSTIMGWLTSGESWSAISAAILSTVGALLGMIPQGLVLLTSSVLAIATIRLARRKVLAQQLYCIETLARVDVLCLDKTGTITSGRMEVEGTYLAESDGSVVACSREDGAKLPAGRRPMPSVSPPSIARCPVSLVRPRQMRTRPARRSLRATPMRPRCRGPFALWRSPLPKVEWSHVGGGGPGAFVRDGRCSVRFGVRGLFAF